MGLATRRLELRWGSRMKNENGFPGLLERFFTQRLIAQRRVSSHTIASYRDTFRLLLQFVEKRLHKPPSGLTLTDLGKCPVDRRK